MTYLPTEVSMALKETSAMQSPASPVPTVLTYQVTFDVSQKRGANQQTYRPVPMVTIHSKHVNPTC